MAGKITVWKWSISAKFGFQRGLYRSSGVSSLINRRKIPQRPKDALSQQPVRVRVWHHGSPCHWISGQICLLIPRAAWRVERVKDGTPSRPPLRKYCLHQTPSRSRPRTNQWHQRLTNILSKTRPVTGDRRRSMRGFADDDGRVHLSSLIPPTGSIDAIPLGSASFPCSAAW